MNEISALMKGAPVSSLNLFLPSGDAKSKQESATPKRVITRAHPWWHPDLRLLASRTVRNKFLLFINCSV